MVITFTENEIRDILAAEVEKRLGIAAEVQSAEDAHFNVTDENGEQLEFEYLVFSIDVTFPALVKETTTQ